MATTMAFFCAHKRLRTACPDCTPTIQPPSALHEDDPMPPVRRPRRAA